MKTLCTKALVVLLISSCFCLGGLLTSQPQPYKESFGRAPFLRGWDVISMWGKIYCTGGLLGFNMSIALPLCRRIPHENPITDKPSRSYSTNGKKENTKTSHVRFSMLLFSE